MIANGVAVDATDEYVRVEESTALECLRKFVVEVFGPGYLRLPNEHDTTRLLAIGESRRFTGILGSIDCMHWGWKNSHTTWHNIYRGHKKKPTTVLEADASKDLWIWHAFFGMPGSHNNINVLQRSPIFTRLAEGQGSQVNYNINVNDYSMGYYLADEIYPSWAIFVKIIPEPQGNKKKYFCQGTRSM
jgi:hypothetical protein